MFATSSNGEGSAEGPPEWGDTTFPFGANARAYPEPASVEQIAEWLCLYHGPDALAELRAACEDGGTRGGLYRDLDQLARDAGAVTLDAAGTWTNLNAIRSDWAEGSQIDGCGVLSRAVGSAAIAGRRYLFVEVDPVRPEEHDTHSATDAEKAEALAAATAITDALHARGWPHPIVADSGNGYHVLYRIDRPADPGDDVIRRCLKALAARHDTAGAKVDTAVHDLPRPIKIPGTLARKGPHSAERPHRASAVLHSPPGGPQVVPDGLLEALAAEAPAPPPRSDSYRPPPCGSDLLPGEDFDARGSLEEALGACGATVDGERGGVIYLTRPGKDRGTSASFGKVRGSLDEPLLHVFTSNWPPFEAGKNYGLFRIKCLLTHGTGGPAALSATAKELYAKGYGTQHGRGQGMRFNSNGRGAASAAEEVIDLTPWPDPPAEAAYHGLAGEIVREIEPHTEADPVAVLAQVLAMFGNAIGRKPHWRVEGDSHYGNLMISLVGETGKGRKGTSMGRAKEAFRAVEGDWVRRRITSGLTSGEGLVRAVRDPVYRTEQVKKGGAETHEVLVDAGEPDKRLMVVEPELGRVLKAMQREGNTLSARLREAWDLGDLTNMTKEPLRATGAHISVIGHITRCELRKLLSDVDAANGLANRFLWVAVRRSKHLPLGGNPTGLAELAQRVGEAVREAAKVREVPFNEAAKDLWCGGLYSRLTAGRPGLLGAITNRAEAQVRRLAMLYALLGRCNMVGEPHLRAAEALWDYCARSACWAFGDSSGNRLADDLLDALRGGGVAA